jgi:acyl-CoA hydrolase
VALGACKHDQSTPDSSANVPVEASANAPDAAPPPPRAIRFLALGDSFTQGAGANRGESYPDRVAQAWNAHCHVDLTNVAVSGSTTDELMKQLHRQETAPKPDWIAFTIGANDLMLAYDKGRYHAQLGRIFDRMRSLGWPLDHVIVLPQPDWSSAHFARKEKRVFKPRIQQYNDILRDMAREVGAHYIDLAALLAKQAEANDFSAGGLHPTGHAYGQWAEEVVRLVDGCAPNPPTRTRD